MPKLQSSQEVLGLHRILEDATLNEAFQLTHSIYRYRKADRQVALGIVGQAVSGVKVRLIAQHEADRHDPIKPAKVRWNTLQWLQILLYCKSEAFEKQQEASNKNLLSEDDMIIRYVKHLILTTCRRNSFHISLGLGRLLYDYSAGETMAIYDLVFQDTDSSTRKADAYYRARKNKLIEELQKRFHRFVRIEQGPRGEKRFQSRDNSAQFSDLVREYLTRFTPWETRCKLPERLDPWTTVHSLQSSQQSQIHSLIHPACFGRITEALNLDTPESRLSLPEFFLTGKQSGKTTSSEVDSPSELTKQEADEIRDTIATQERGRKKFITRSLLVLADGVQRVRLDLSESSRVRFDLEGDVTLIEVVGYDDEESQLLLATHVVTHEDDDRDEKQAKEYSVVLEGGQKLSLILTEAGDDDASGFSIEIRYQETKAIRAARLWWRQVRRRLIEKTLPKTWGDVGVFSPRIVVAVLVVIGAAFAIYLVLTSRSDQHIAKQEPSPTIEPGKIPITSTPQTSPTAEPEASMRSSKTGPSPSNSRSSSGNTRAQTPLAVKRLLDVQRIYVESLGDDAFSQTVRQKLIEELQAGNRFVIVKGPNEADTAISGSARQDGKLRKNGQEIGVGSLALQLVNVSGEIIWRNRTSRGTAEQLASQFKRDLFATIEAERRRTKNE